MRPSTLCALLFLAACTPPNGAPDASVPPPPAQPGPPPSPQAQAACDAVKAAGCPEGASPTCAAVVTRVVALDAGFSVSLACLAAAKTPAQVRACGPFVACAGR
jgi:hypothetical protein